MKRYLKGFSLLLAGLTLFVACKDEETIEKAQWDAEENYANIYFEGTSESHEFAPNDECKVTLKVFRRQTKGALTVNLEPTVNTDNVFTVSPAVFADGDSVATYDVTFPNAEVGKTYTLQVTSTDPKLVSSWSQGIVYNLDVIRVKWNHIGQGTIWDWFPYTFDSATGKLDIYQRDDDHNKFRLNNIFEDIAQNAGVTLNGNQTKEAYLTILRKGDVVNGVTVTQADLVMYDIMFTGVVHPSYGVELEYDHPVWFSSLRAESNWSYNKVLGYQENGLPTQIQLAPLYYMEGVGGYNYSQYDEDIIITFPGYEPVVTYEAQFEDDFEWNNVKTFDLTNTLTGESNNVMLQKATCTVNTDGCDATFLNTYGVPYRIKDAYADGYDIVFFVKGKKVYVPEDFDDYILQPTGVSEGSLTKTDIYAYIESEGSEIEFDENGDVKSVTLNVYFTDEDGVTVFGNGAQTLANITWTEYATGTYYYLMFAEGEEWEPDPGYKMYVRDDKPEYCKITEWLMGTDFLFTWDRETNACRVAEQYIGYDHPSYGPMYAIEGADWSSSYGKNTSYYDPETKTFHFFPAYVVSAGSFGQVEELFEITEGGAAVRKFAPAWGSPEISIRYNKTQKAWNLIKANLAKRVNKNAKPESLTKELK